MKKRLLSFTLVLTIVVSLLSTVGTRTVYAENYKFNFAMPTEYIKFASFGKSSSIQLIICTDDTTRTINMTKTEEVIIIDGTEYTICSAASNIEPTNGNTNFKVTLNIQSTTYTTQWYSNNGEWQYGENIIAVPQGWKTYSMVTSGKEGSIKFIKYTVTFDVQDHGTAPESQRVPERGYAVKPTDPTETGYSFDGWYKEASCTSKWDFEIDTVTKDTTLYAKWTPIYTLTFEANGGTGSMDPQTFTSGTAQALTKNAFTKAGYIFSGWMSNGGNSYSDEQEITVSSDMILNAMWKEAKYIVTYDANGATSGTAPSDTDEYKYNDSVYVFGNTGSLTKTGYTFTGWNTKADGTGTDHAISSTFNITEDTTLYAKWEADTKYTVTYDANGATSGTAPSDTTKYPENAFVYVFGNPGSLTKTGYTFTGWNTKADGTGTDHAISSTFNITEDTTLYAKWEAETTLPKITEGENQKIDITKTETATFRSDAEFSTFIKVRVDGNDVDPQYYDKKEGSTIITLKKAYLSTLKNGEHEIAIMSQDGTASCCFSISGNPPKTGDSSNLWLYIVIAALALGAICIELAVMQKKANRQ